MRKEVISFEELLRFMFDKCEKIEVTAYSNDFLRVECGFLPRPVAFKHLTEILGVLGEHPRVEDIFLLKSCLFFKWRLVNDI